MTVLTTATLLLAAGVANAADKTDASLLATDPYQLSSHVLDTSMGKGASSVEVKLFKAADDKSETWTLVDTQKTDSNGRIKTFLPREKGNAADKLGKYKLTFATGAYYQAQKKETFYPNVSVEFSISDNTHYHVPITLTQYGYSTYRGN
ncbi:hydroxyisourate hydrolase [Aeromonas cavernicola]|uniref:5-hydroxyisourate hydrolase n=2 Tax=Aeromonas cavernicola TaxID=1006623 RepID=A0A2H9U3M8_9GAMM|nr:hydroxyisourate hydrolase [Aeromonas cavernicola]